ncbi:MAG: otsA [Ilumatobacteraceae bacterium]|nr:otsA [Ilumatobacteraceae bacterium]
MSTSDSGGPGRGAFGGHQLVVVANRLPVALVDGEWRSSPGGLVRALLGFLRPTAALWVGWAGTADEPQAEFASDGIDVATISLAAEQIRGYYDSISNDAIWPLYHDALRTSTYDNDDWRIYAEVNERFATRTAEVAAEGAVVWVHDYQLQLVPAMLRRLRPDLRIGFFLHIPFPPQELFMRFPWREEVLEGMLGADLIGFQRRVAAENFISLAHRLVDAEVVDDGVRTADGRFVRVGSFPVSIDIDEVAGIAADPVTVKAAARIRRRLGDPPTVLLGVDRLDYTKGIGERLTAFGELLRNRAIAHAVPGRPEVVLVQIAVPSRENVGDYQAQREHVEQLVGAVNGEFATLGYPAVHYLHRSLPLDQLIALYLATDVMVVTPLRDGMNLVAKEFVAARGVGDGVLVLSEFAGAADEFTDAVIVNPHDPHALVEAMETAIAMPRDEAIRRMSALQDALLANDAQHWAASFLEHLVR